MFGKINCEIFNHISYVLFKINLKYKQHDDNKKPSRYFIFFKINHKF